MSKMKLTAKQIERLVKQGEVVHIGERSGTGLADLYGHWKKNNLPAPVITEEYDPDRVRITVYTDSGQSTANRPKSAPKTAQGAPKVPQNIGYGLNTFIAATKQVYKAMCEDITLTHRGLESKLGLSKTTIRKATATLVQKGFIRRVGPKNGGHWEVVK